MPERLCKDCNTPVSPKKQRCEPCRVARKKATNAAFWQRAAQTKPLLTCARCSAIYGVRPGQPTMRHLCQTCATAQYRENERERDRVRQAAGSRKIPENARAYASEYKRKNVEWNRLHSKLYKQRHPHKVREQINRRRALKESAPGDITIEEFWASCDRRGWECSYCHDALTKASATMDHVVPLSRGGSNGIDNIAPCCRRCNASKGNRLLSEWIGRARAAA